MSHDHGPGAYGAAFADVYDDWYGNLSDLDTAVRGLARLAGGDRVLELGVGTGRVALPLVAAGVDVLGIDASAEMIRVLTAKVGAESIGVVVADMAELPFTTGSVGLTFAAFNTFFNLSSATDQSRCFAEVARVLRPGGAFTIEGFVPTAGMPARGASVRDVTPDSVVVMTTVHDATSQVIEGQHVEVTPAGVTRRPWTLRYATPTQLDAMAAPFGLVLESRSTSWSSSGFDTESATHVSIYRLSG